MRLEIEMRRTKSRRLATLSVPRDEVRQGLDRLRSWALTRGIELHGPLTWLLGSPGEPVEVRCPIPPGIEVHPDTGIIVRQAPAQYEAVVRMEHDTPPPEHVASILVAWAHASGYEENGQAEVALLGQNTVGYELSLPVRRSPRSDYIEV